MPNKRDLLLITGTTIGLILLIVLGGCGLLTGNPENMVGSNSPAAEKFSELRLDYLTAQEELAEGEIDCGSFTENSTKEEVDVGEECIRTAFTGCTNAIYLLDENLSNGAQFASFVRVVSCELYVHTISTDTDRFVGDQAESCTTLDDDEPIELACGIGN